MGAMEAAQTLAWPHAHVYMPTEPTAAKARPVSAVGALVVHLVVPQVFWLGWCSSSPVLPEGGLGGWGWVGGVCLEGQVSLLRWVPLHMPVEAGAGRWGREPLAYHSTMAPGFCVGPGFFRKLSGLWSSLLLSLQAVFFTANSCPLTRSALQTPRSSTHTPSTPEDT